MSDVTVCDAIGELSRQQLEDQHPEGVDVGAGRDRLTGHLLGTRIGRRPRGAELVSDVSGLRRREGDPEVGQVHVAFVVEQQVARLDVAVHDARMMSRAQCATDLIHDPHGLVEIERAVDETILDGPAAQPAHHEVRAARLSPEVVQRHDVGMLEAGDELRLALEPADERGVVGEIRVDDLHRDIAAHTGLGRAVHDPEATLTELLAQLVAPQRSGRGSFVEARVARRDHPLELDQLA